MPPVSDSPVLHFEDGGAFESWIAAQPKGSAGVWLKLAKKGSGVASITYAEALDIALCHGWIDGLKRPLDDTFWLQRFKPRKPRSKWSKINCGKADALIVAGRMQPGGQAEIDQARADGRWDAAYAGQSSAEVPADLQVALDANAAAAAFFTALDKANRYAILFRIHDAKRPETRAARIAKFVGMLSRGERIHEPAKRRKAS